MEKYLAGKASPEEEHKVLMWLMLNLKSPSANDDFTALLDKVQFTEDQGSGVADIFVCDAAAVLRDEFIRNLLLHEK